MLTRVDDYDTLYDQFAWRIPEMFNMGVDVCDKHAERAPEDLALIVTGAEGDTVHYSFGAIRALSNQFANVLQGLGVERGDRVGVLLPQSLEAAVTHVAAWKAAMISIPLFTLFGEEALEFRLADSGARAIVTDRANLPKIEAIRDRLPALDHVFLIDGPGDGDGQHDLWASMGKASDAFAPIATRAGDPGLIVYTSGTTGNPKGALHAHRTLLGHLPGVEMFHNFLPQPGDLMWTPADWAWIGGLMNTLMASWHHGVPVVAYRARKYDPEEALALMARLGIRNTFMPPTALRLMTAVENPARRFDLKLRSVACAGEPMGAELLNWGRENLGTEINEYYGQTEFNLVVSNCTDIMEAKAGSMGRAVPGHVVEVIDADGQILPPGNEGDIACRAPDPVMLLEYWNNPEATQANFRGDWWLMGDTAYKDDDGYIWFVGRGDDVITSAGYRIGPGEIEDCLAKHPAVALAAVIGVPDPVRTQAVKAYIQCVPGHNGGPDLEAEIRDYVKTRLSPHEYPRQIQFVDSLPMTATGKIKRKELRDADLAKADPSA